MQLEQFCNIVPQIGYLPEYDMKDMTSWYGIKALWYEGAPYQGKRTKVFAHIGYPKMAEGDRVPAVVLVHGGGGHAFPEWIRKWNERGFAAIAMDTTGYIPDETWKGIVGTEEPPSDESKYVHELYGELVEEGYTLGPDNARMLDCDLPLEEQWMYHAVADTILAHNILLSDNKINPSKIGIVGISWGAVIASIAIGYDTRYAFANPIYGSAYLDYQPAPALPGVFRESMVKKLWSAADRLNRVKFPILWKCWCYDACFSIGANSLSYLATKDNSSFLSMSFDMGHSHCCGWNSEESYRFAEGVVDDKLPLIRIVTEPKGFEDISFEVSIPEDFKNVSARIHYLTETMEYDENNQMIKKWEAIPAEIKEHHVKGHVPKSTVCYFVETEGFVNGVKYVTNSSLVERKM